MQLHEAEVDCLKACCALQRLGWYNPLNKETNLNAPAIKKWISVGAKPTEATARLLKKAMVIDADTPIAS